MRIQSNNKHDQKIKERSAATSLYVHQTPSTTTFSTVTKSISMSAKPFLKWVGGKQQLLGQFEDFLTIDIKRYLEPFIGGGAVFFHFWNTGRLPKNVFLLDNNEELINTYRVVRDQVDALIEQLTIHKRRHNQSYYYKIRDLDRRPVNLTEVERAARTIYLNRTCYNGLYRVNSRGQFNVPIGSYKEPQIVYEETLKAASTALQSKTIASGDFRKVVELAKAGDFFYFDPPYDPVSKTASFTSYTSANFSDDDQRDLAQVFAQLTDMKCRCMLSNSYTPFILELYRNFRIEVVQAKRAVNSNGNGRGQISEVVVLNY
jgi:DNA adenine methylase